MTRTTINFLHWKGIEEILKETKKHVLMNTQKSLYTNSLEINGGGEEEIVLKAEHILVALFTNLGEPIGFDNGNDLELGGNHCATVGDKLDPYLLGKYLLDISDVKTKHFKRFSIDLNDKDDKKMGGGWYCCAEVEELKDNKGFRPVSTGALSAYHEYDVHETLEEAFKFYVANTLQRRKDFDENGYGNPKNLLDYGRKEVKSYNIVYHDEK